MQSCGMGHVALCPITKQSSLGSAIRIFRVERARQSLVNLFERGRVVRDGELAMWEVRWWPAYEGTIGGMPAVDRAVSARAAVAVDR